MKRGAKVYRRSIKLTSKNLDKIRRSILIASTGASTRLAGAKLSDKEIEAFIKLTYKKLTYKLV